MACKSNQTARDLQTLLVFSQHVARFILAQ